MSYGTTPYLVLPLCIEPGSHHFTIPVLQLVAVCTRCGLIREQPAATKEVRNQ